MEGALVISGSEVREYTSKFTPKRDDTIGDNSPEIVKNQPMQPYFESIASAGKYVVGVYTKSGNTWTEFDSDQKSAFVRTSSGFYTNLCNFAGGKDNYPFVRGSNGIKMQLDYVQVRYD